MRVLIVGEGKSGTTALLRSVSAQLDSPAEMFEPTVLSHEDLEPDPLVVKKLLLNWKRSEGELLDVFDKRVFIVRDPRDRLVSHLLYDAYNKAPALSAEARERWLSLLQRKIDKPQKVSLIHVMNTWWRLSRGDLVSHYVRAIDRSRGFSRRSGDRFHRLKYEDYVESNFDEINEYLGVALSPGVVRSSESRVARSQTHGEWRSWFTPIDVRLFRPLSHDWLKDNGYDFRDWELADDGELDPDSTVGYVKSLFDRRPINP